MNTINQRIPASAKVGKPQQRLVQFYRFGENLGHHPHLAGLTDLFSHAPGGAIIASEFVASNAHTTLATGRFGLKTVTQAGRSADKSSLVQFSMAGAAFLLTNIDPLTTEQRLPWCRFDNAGKPFSANPAAYQVDPTDPNQRGDFKQGLLQSAYQHQALVPLWEVQTAKLQDSAGLADADQSEAERAAKAGLSAALDTAYASSHPNDPQAANKRLGQFMAVGLDLDGDGQIAKLSRAQTAALNNGAGIGFDWDQQGYQKPVGWIDANDALLVLDRDFNQSIDTGAELLSNPLVTDAAKGLRSLATWDANGDGKISAADPIYGQLKVWQDLNQDGNNTYSFSVNSASGVQNSLVQDQSNGIQELRGLSELGITAIDYGNGRYEMVNPDTGAVAYRSISSVSLEAAAEGVRYTPVGAGIKIESTDGPPLIVITQVQSEAAVLNSLTLSTAGESIGSAEAPLFEDGEVGAYNPITQGNTRTLLIAQDTLLANDTWHGQSGTAAGLRLAGLSNASHVTGLSLDANNNVRYQLEANFFGVAGFDYSVVAPDGSCTVNLPNSAPGQELMGMVERDLVFGNCCYELGSTIRTRYLGYRPISCTKLSISAANDHCWSNVA